MARKWPVTLGLLHRPLHAHAWKLAQPGGNRNRNLRAAVFGQPENPRPQDAPTGSACLESADESRSRQDQLEVRSKSRSPQVRLQKEILHAVKDLGAQLARITAAKRELRFPTAMHVQSNRPDRTRGQIEASAR